MPREWTVRPIAYIETDFREKFGIPRQAGRVKELFGRIVFEPQYRSAEAVRALEGFSHLWLLFDFSESHRADFSPTVRPPRLGGNERVGVFASRSPFRPNPIGLSAVRLERIEQTAEEGTVLWVSGVDLLSGTPILDIKPYLPFADSIPEATAGYAAEHRDHRLSVRCEPQLLSDLPEQKRRALLACLAEDPRPSYQEDGREYAMSFCGKQVRFFVSGDTLTVQSVCDGTEHE